MPPPPVVSRSFAALRGSYDTWVVHVVRSRALRRAVQNQAKTNLESLWAGTLRELLDADVRRGPSALEPFEIHRQIVVGLPGEALFASAAMAFDSMNEALALFDLSAKTAKQRLGERLSTGESELALRIGRVLTMAQEVFGSADAARKYLRTPNFALGGVVPRDLLKTAEGEQLVLAEIQTQSEGGPV